MKKLNKKIKAFTLIELLVVISIIGILVAISVFGLDNYFQSARDTQRKSDLKQYQTLMEGYANKNNGLFYSTSENPNTLNTIWTAVGMSGNAPLDPLDNQNVCQGAQQCRYYYRALPTQYVFYGALEKPATSSSSARWWVYCSNGKSGEVATAPANSTCPIP